MQGLGILPRQAASALWAPASGECLEDSETPSSCTAPPAYSMRLREGDSVLLECRDLPPARSAGGDAVDF